MFSNTSATSGSNAFVMRTPNPKNETGNIESKAGPVRNVVDRSIVCSPLPLPPLTRAGHSNVRCARIKETDASPATMPVLLVRISSCLQKVPDSFEGDGVFNFQFFSV
ncbi:hypothetical protein CDAR_442251 [Caerostris darwini]|uniref:Uncharacterized protein n=1 Tax=Caerostris darwini TaxID=1538125 RepID=A0AAV4V008_9ARAC|nr:hypothetical protein CDAR_442251 [Caerostris darwini]